jgi:acyl transferase domain-containing protein
VLGHSIGELAAACAAGVMDPADALRLVIARGAGMGALPEGGAMVSIAASEAEVAAMIRCPETTIAAINGPRLLVVAGPEASVAAIVQQAFAAGIHTRRLPVSHAFHSPLMAPMVETFARRAAAIGYRAPRLPFVSTVTGAPAGDELASADYWVRQVLAPVRFHQALAAVPAEVDTLVEIGPQAALTTMAGRAGLADRRLLPTASAGREDAVFLAAVAALYEGGVDVDLTRVVDGDRRRVALPGYPWQRQRHWHAAAKAIAFPVAERPAPTPAAPDGALDIVQRQLALMSLQLELLGDGASAEPASLPHTPESLH